MKQINVDDLSDDAQLRVAKKYLSETLFPMLKDEISIATFLENIEMISVNYLSRDDFLQEINCAEDSKGIPRAFCLNKKIYFQQDVEVNGKRFPVLKHEEFHVLIHEMLHALSDNFKYTGKTGLQQYYIDDNGDLYSDYKIINEAATEYLASNLLGEPFIGSNIDLKYVLQMVMELTGMDDEELLNLYFQDKNWVNEDLSMRFNSSDPTLLHKMLTLYDGWFPSSKKHDILYDFSNVSEILLNTVNYKIDNHELLDYKKIYHLLNKLLKKCYWIEINENIIEKYNDTLDRLTLFVKNR